MNIKSPLTGKSNTIFENNILCSNLIENYSKTFNIDISRFFQSYESIQIYRCLETGYRFFYPFNIDGDGKFYEHLQQFDWYYMPWKWEHNVTKKLLSGNEKILEVGSGGLGFVDNLQKSGFDITGLELNKQSIIKAFEQGLKILNETVQEHAKNNFGKYDLVCSYQVLEHITEVYSFIEAQVDCLKRGGKLIISVPNNDSFIKLTKGGLLNFPPHHMGLWNKKSLISIVNLFDLKVDKILYEPLQEYHMDWYINSTMQEKIFKNRFARIIFNRFKLRNLYSYLVKKIRTKIHGHTIMVIFTKV